MVEGRGAADTRNLDIAAAENARFSDPARRTAQIRVCLVRSGEL
jgi:hypothetical protein